jgi:TolB-like protein/tetratricopeptide (TPR) repeat protein
MAFEFWPGRPEGHNSAHGKIIPYPRKRPTMSGTIESHASPRTPDSRSQAIRATLERLLGTQHFSASSRRGQLLRYLVEHTLAGDADKINEYAIGLDVFQRPTSFDPRIESVVRTEFSRLRQRLKDYYAEGGRRDTIVIDFPPRSYVASFTFRDAAKLGETTAFPEPARAPQLVPPSAPQNVHGERRVWLAGAIIVTCVAALVVAGIMLWNQHASIAVTKQAIQEHGQEPIHAIVVLPFENYSPDHRDDYVADGITEELTNDLAQWRELRVVARTSAFAFKGKGEDVRQIGQQLNVDTVLEGSFTRLGDHVRITAQLNRATDGYHLWSHSYETQSNDMLAMQDEVATSITDAIRQIGGGSPPVIRPPTENSEALDLYLQGEYQYHLRTPDSLAKAIDLFEAALKKDPNFARAYLGIGNAEIAATSLTVIPSDRGIPRAREAAQKAIQLDPTLGDAYGLLAAVTYVWDWNWNDAEPEFRRALNLGADADVRARFGWSLASRGRFAEAHEQFRLAAEQDPLSIVPPWDEFFTYNFERDAAGQKKSVARLVEIQPGSISGHLVEVVMEASFHDCAALREESAWLNKNYPAVPGTQTALAFAAICDNNKPEALRLVTKMRGMQAPHYQLAIVYAMLNERETAIEELSKSADAHEGQILYIKYDPFFDGIRDDRRYVALEKRVGLM